MTVRVPTEHRKVYEAAAAAEGLSLGDFVTQVLARVFELEEPEYIARERARRRSQATVDQLPLAAGQ